MNRKIKFRCWNVEEKIMHKPAFPSWNGCIEVWQDNKQQTKVQYLSYGPADEGILMQFTGLKDKNGVDVYEGDVVRYKDANTDTVAIIGFIDGAFTVEYSEKTILHVTYPFIEVIGNIYQNPELLNL